MLGLTHPGQVEHEPAGTNPRMWGLTQLPSYGRSGGTGSSWGPRWLRKVHCSWGFISRPWLGGAAVEVPADACAGSSPVPAGSAESWEQQPQPGGVWLLPLVTPDRECARRGRAGGPRGVTGHRHKLLQTARNQETLKTPESFPARAQFCLVLVPKNKLEEGELRLEHRARCQSLCHRGQCPGCAPSQLCPVGLRAGWCCRVLQDILGFYYFSNPLRFTTWARRAAPAPV